MRISRETEKSEETLHAENSREMTDFKERDDQFQLVYTHTYTRARVSRRSFRGYVVISSVVISTSAPSFDSSKSSRRAFLPRAAKMRASASHHVSFCQELVLSGDTHASALVNLNCVGAAVDPVDFSYPNFLSSILTLLTLQTR